MTSRFRQALAAFVCLSTCDAAAQQVSRLTATEAAAAVVEIRARNCSEGPNARIGTGFAYGEPAKIVTAHHVVAGCRDIELWYERTRDQPRRSARIERVLIKRDLALLGVEDPPNRAALRPAETVDLDAPLKALGYAVGQPTLGDHDLRISIGSNLLSNMLPTENRSEISRDTAIDLDTVIYRFSAPLYPGMSGGPIFDANGRVVAVVAGGLKSGAVSASWGWPATLLRELLTSRETIDAGGRVAATQFSFATDLEVRPSILCGMLDLERGAQLSFREIAASSDNSQRLDQTVQFSTRPRSEIDALRFDVWAHRQSGATVVVPAGAELTMQNGACLASSRDGVFQQIVWGAPAVSSVDVQQAALTFENTLMVPLAMPNIGFYSDQVLSLNGPQTRQDGLIVNRKAFFVFKTLVSPGRARSIHQFETIMARGGSFVGVAAINTQIDQCLNQTSGWTLCTFDPAYVKQWAHFVLATQMSTYPIY